MNFCQVTLIFIFSGGQGRIIWISFGWAFDLCGRNFMLVIGENLPINPLGVRGEAGLAGEASWKCVPLRAKKGQSLPSWPSPALSPRYYFSRSRLKKKLFFLCFLGCRLRIRSPFLAVGIGNPIFFIIFPDFPGQIVWPLSPAGCNFSFQCNKFKKSSFSNKKEIVIVPLTGQVL